MKTLKELCESLAIEMERMSTELEDIMEKLEPKDRSKIARITGFLDGSANAIRTWPTYFTEKK